MSNSISNPQAYIEAFPQIVSALDALIAVNKGVPSSAVAAKLDADSVNGLLMVAGSLLEQVYGQDSARIQEGLAKLRSNMTTLVEALQ